MIQPRLVVPILFIIAAACSRAPEESTGTLAETRAPAAPAVRDPVAGETTVLGPFTGFDAPLHPGNTDPRPAYYGTDLGWSYQHDGRIHFIFGDTHRNEKGEGLTPTHDDSFGAIALADWPDPAKIKPGNVPPILMGQFPGKAELIPIDTGQPMEGLKTPNGAFSNGTREFGMFITGKPLACRTDSQCPVGFTCDGQLGYFGSPPHADPGLTLACAETWPGCNADTLADSAGEPVAGSGLCVDRGTSMAVDSEFGRMVAGGMKLLVGVRNQEQPGMYEDMHVWFTNRFINVASRGVADFVPERGRGRKNQDYRNIRGSGGNQRVLLWGRPWFNGVNAKGQNDALYFAYVDMPAGPGFEWNVHYYTGSDDKGMPLFSDSQMAAAQVDLDSKQPGTQPQEIHDFVQHMSIVWIEELQKWVMFYGGGISTTPNVKFGLPNCGLLEIFARTECRNVVVGNGALRMRTADDPWGPWSPPQDLIVAGTPGAAGGQYGPGGVLYHQSCKGEGCQAPSLQFPADDYGWFYGANIIEEWTRPAGDGVDVIWLASTWDPYRVIMLRTRINK